MLEEAEERVSVRVEKDIMKKVDDKVRQKQYSNRSEFLRRAARALLEADARKYAVTVELSPLIWDYINSLVDRGFYTTHAEALSDAVKEYFTQERQAKITGSAGGMEVATGRKVEAEVGIPARQIVKP